MELFLIMDEVLAESNASGRGKKSNDWHVLKQIDLLSLLVDLAEVVLSKSKKYQTLFTLNGTTYENGQYLEVIEEETKEVDV